MRNYEELFSIYECTKWNDQTVKKACEKIIDTHIDKNRNTEVYKRCFNLIDLTSLNVTDNEQHISQMVEKVNNFEQHYEEMPSVAAICVYPNMVSTVKDTLTEPLQITSVAGGFPSSQTFVEIKVAEVALALESGATEVDIVLSVGTFLDGRYQEIHEEISEIKQVCKNKNAHLKVILETGALKSAEHIAKASLLAMDAGADFIKTSTGKIDVSATVESTYIMSNAIKEWNQKNSEKVGYKPAGGISTTEEALQHFTLVQQILGKEWLNNKLFRFGASRLANELLSSIYNKEIKYF